MNRRPKWPTPDPTKGRALTALEAAARLGCSDDYVYVRLKRTREGKPVRVMFPEPDGQAYPDEGRRQLVSYWWESTMVEYGRAAKLLDGLDRPKDTPLKMRPRPRRRTA